MLKPRRFKLKRARYHWLARGATYPYAAVDPKRHIQALRDEAYHSQYGQDKWIVEHLLSELEGGVYVDIGAHDGVELSNTLALENRGWHGIAFEPHPTTYKRLRENRRCVCINACVNADAGPVDFQVIEGESEMLSGMLDTFHPRHHKRLEREVDKDRGAIRVIQVPCVRLADALNEHGFDVVDYMDIDVEGGELNVLRSIDFSRVRVRVIGVENNYVDWRIPAFLTRRGFRFHSVVGDEFYVHRGLTEH